MRITAPKRNVYTEGWAIQIRADSKTINEFRTFLNHNSSVFVTPIFTGGSGPFFYLTVLTKDARAKVLAWMAHREILHDPFDSDARGLVEHNYVGDNYDMPEPAPSDDYPVRCIYHCGQTFPLSKAREHNLARHPLAICIGEGHTKDKRQKRVVEGLVTSVCVRCHSLFLDP